ncbi:unnamed protein product [Phaeothamnion confervicola]
MELPEAVVVAARSGDNQGVSLYLQSGGAVDAVAVSSGRSLLHMAAFNVSLELARAILAFRPDLALQDHRGLTALGTVEMLQAFVSGGGGGGGAGSLPARLAALHALLTDAAANQAASHGMLLPLTAAAATLTAATAAAPVAAGEPAAVAPAAAAGPPVAVLLVPSNRGRSEPVATAANPGIPMQRSSSCQPDLYQRGLDVLRGRTTAGLQLFTDVALLRMTSEEASIPEAEAHLYIEREPLAPDAAATGDNGGVQETKRPSAAEGDAAALAAAAAAADFGADAPSVETMMTAAAAVETARCAICLEDHVAADLLAGLCGGGQCLGRFCKPCLAGYCESVVQRSRYSLPPIKCPSCAGRIATASWRALVPPPIFDEYRANAHALLTIRCSGCHMPQKLFDATPPLRDPVARAAAIASLRGDFGPAATRDLLLAWRKFERGARAADDVIDAVVTGLWVCRPLEQPQPDLAGAPTTLEAEDERWEKWGGIVVGAVLPLVRDLERRAVLQLAWLRRYPFLRTYPCECGQMTCFKCKVEGCHPGVTCAEVQARELEGSGVQFCPGCNVATVKSEACNHMVCVCGEDWTWVEE